MFRILQHYLILADQRSWTRSIISHLPRGVMLFTASSRLVSSRPAVTFMRNCPLMARTWLLERHSHHHRHRHPLASPSRDSGLAHSDCQRARCIFHLAVNATTRPHQQQNIKKLAPSTRAVSECI